MTRAERAARATARLATVAAVAGGVAGVLLWASTAGHRIDDDGRGALVSLLVLALCLAPAGWLLNVRFSLLALLDLPATVAGVAVRRGTPVLPGPRGAGGNGRPA
ncbi:MAG: hypothetical protein ACR2HV_06895 [Acidimicrobiales bacterium]